MYTSTVQSGPPLLMLHSHPHPRLPTSYPPSAHFISSPSAPPPPSLAPCCPSTPPASSLPHDSLRVLQWNAGGLRARNTELLHFLSSNSVDLIWIQKSKSNSSSSFRIPGFSALRSDHTHSRSGIGLSFSELSTSSLSALEPYADYVGVNISLNNSSLLSFFNVYALPICSSPTDGRTDSFSPSILSSSSNFFILGDFNCHQPLWDSRGTSNPVGRKYSTGSSLLTSSPSMTLTHPPFSIALLALAPLLTSPLLPPLLLFLALGRCFRTGF